MLDTDYELTLEGAFDDDSSESVTSNKFAKIREAASDVVVFSTDWTTETIVSQINRGNIDLNPAFQRRNAWLEDRKSKFIESLFLGLPVPQIVLAENPEKKGSFIVIDGKQRLLTIMQFCSPDGLVFQSFKLNKLEILTGLNGKTRSSIESVGIFPDMTQVDIASFDNQPIRTVIIRNWHYDVILYEIFLRLNQGSVQLSPQELRQALLPGGFTNFVDNASADNDSIREILKLKQPDRRMRDAELLTRYYAFNNFIDKYDGDLKDFFDMTCSVFNERWNKEQEDLTKLTHTFDLAYEAAKTIFGQKGAFRKWYGDKFEPRINRPLFDLFMYYLSDHSIRSDALDHKVEVLSAFKTLCLEDYSFMTSIERGTANISPTRYRFQKIAELLTGAIGKDIQSPIIAAHRRD